MQNAPFTKAIKEKLFELPKHHPKLGKVKEYEKSNSKNARNTKRQNLKPVKNDRSGLLVLKPCFSRIFKRSATPVVLKLFLMRRT